MLPCNMIRSPQPRPTTSPSPRILPLPPFSHTDPPTLRLSPLPTPPNSTHPTQLDTPVPLQPLCYQSHPHSFRHTWGCPSVFTFHSELSAPRRPSRKCPHQCPHQRHSASLRRPLFSYSYTLHCTYQNAISPLFFSLRTLCRKHPGWAYPFAFSVGAHRSALPGGARGLVYTLVGSFAVNNHDSVPASRSGLHPDFWFDGRHRHACLRLYLASRFRPSPVAAPEHLRTQRKGRRIFDHWDRGPCRLDWRKALPRSRKSARVFCRPLAATLQPLRFRLVRRFPRRIYRAAHSRSTSKNPLARISGHLFARGLRRLWHWTHRMPALRRRRLWRFHFAPLGHEFSERPCADHSPRPSHSYLRILHLDWDRGVSLAHGHESSQGTQSQRRDFLQLPHPYWRRPFFDRDDSYQPAFVFRHVQRADGKRCLHPPRRGVALASQKPIPRPEERASHRRAYRLARRCSPTRIPSPHTGMSTSRALAHVRFDDRRSRSPRFPESDCHHAQSRTDCRDRHFFRAEHAAPRRRPESQWLRPCHHLRIRCQGFLRRAAALCVVGSCAVD